MNAETADIVRRLYGLQGEVARYADEWFPLHPEVGGDDL